MLYQADDRLWSLYLVFVDTPVICQCLTPVSSHCWRAVTQLHRHTVLYSSDNPEPSRLHRTLLSVKPLLLQLSYHHYYKEAFTVDYMDWLFCHDLSHLLKITTGHSEVSESRLWQVRFIGTRDIISQLTPLYYMYILNWKKNQWIPNKCTCLVHFPSFFALCLITNVLQNHSLLQPQQRQPRVIAEYFITTSVHVYIVLKKTG